MLVILVGAFSSGQAVGADGRWTDLSDTVFQHYSREQGLPHPIVTALAEDADGFLWVGTQDGLARWDGYRFHTYKPVPGDPDALPDSYVNTLHADRQGRLWIGTSAGGLVRYDPGRDRFVTYAQGPDGLPLKRVDSIADDGADGLWIVADGALDHLDPVTGASAALRRDSNDPGTLPDKQVWTVMRDHLGGLWVGTRRGLAHRAAGAATFETVVLPARECEGAQSARTLFEDAAGRIWVGTGRCGAVMLDRASGTTRVIVEEPGETGIGIERQTVNAIGEAEPGHIWLETYGDGIVTVDTATAKIRRIRHDPAVATSLAHDLVWALLKDRAGTTWIGTARGLDRTDGDDTAVLTVFETANRTDGLAAPDVNAILPTPDGLAWLGFGTGGGIDIVDPAGGRTARLMPDRSQPDTALPTEGVYAMAAADGGTYIGTSRGLYRSDRTGQTVARVIVPDRDPDMGVSALLLDGRTLWIGSRSVGFQGLAIQDGEPPGLAFETPPALTDQRVSAIEHGADGDLWIGTLNGLNRFTPGTGAIERILPDPADPHAMAAGFVSSLLLDREGRLWVGTLGGGLQMMTGRDAAGVARFRRWGRAEGLPSQNVGKLLQDAQGRIWASTADGLAVVDPHTFTIDALHAADGVSIPTYWVGSGAATPAGELLFGGQGGLTIVRPERLKPWRYRPPIVVTDIRAAGKPVPIGPFNGSGDKAPLILSAPASSVAVEFSALDYTAPELNRYAYRLSGFEEGWTETDPTRRLATYTNLRPGDYSLQIRGSKRAGLWTETELRLPIRVLPAWYQTLWFSGALVVAGLAAIVTLVQTRTAYLRRQQRHLERQVAARTADLEMRTAQLQESKRHLEEIAYIDPLTSLANRRGFQDEFRKRAALASRENGSFALLLIDLDRFKQINDTLGHDAGDVLLIEAALRFKATVRIYDSVFRLGGDEFAILLIGSPEPAAIETVCRRVIDGFVAAIPYGATMMKTSASIGIATYPAHGITQDGLFKSADMALYEAKAAGRNTWRWSGPVG
jgi:diguanylate cyclase (GGDEF)-like protein